MIHKLPTGYISLDVIRICLRLANSAKSLSMGPVLAHSISFLLAGYICSVINLDNPGTFGGDIDQLLRKRIRSIQIVNVTQRETGLD